MSEAEKPNKKEVCEALLAGPWVFVHLDPRREGVIVPTWFKNQPQLVLQLGLNMAVPIPDLEVGDDAITCTLSFSRQRHFCRLPWSAIYALLGDDARGMVWPEDVPAEVAAQSRAQKQPAPKLAAVATPKPPAPATLAAATPKVTALPKPAARAAQAPVASAATTTEKSATPAAAGKAASKKAEPKPKKGKAKPKANAETKAAPVPVPAAAAQASDDSTSEEIADIPPKKAKRELPPYLRVIK